MKLVFAVIPSYFFLLKTYMNENYACKRREQFAPLYSYKIQAIRIDNPSWV